MKAFPLRKIIDLKEPEFVQLMTKQQYSKKFVANGDYKYEHKDIIKIEPAPKNKGVGVDFP